MESLFSSLTQAMSGSFEFALLAAMGWGILSILLSPCHLTSIPLIIGYISSREKITLKGSFGMSLIFAVGILISIALVGLITASFGRLIGDVGILGNILVAAIFILVGLYLMDIFPISWSGFGLHPEKSKGWVGAFVLGLVFGVSLGPCTFAYMAPVLGLVISLAATTWLKPMLLVSAFGIGHCTVIVGAGTLTRTVQKYLQWTSASKTTTYLKRFAGVLVLLGGVYFIYTTF